ncbi:MAG TPA: hypothetical protein PLA08_03860 [Candidatus Cloacimonadota bacterium]|nr:hypothetical protein [Candidatus Cloacimonadota bacterium]
MKARYLLIMVSLLVISTLAFAYDVDSRTALGLHFGTSSGNGYSMRWMKGDRGLQCTFGAYTAGSNDNVDYYDDDSYLVSIRTAEGRRTSLELAANYLHTLDEFPNGLLYIMAGGSFKYFQKRMFEVDVNNHQIDWDSERSYLKRQLRWTIGAGPGFEIGYGSNFRFALEVPLTYNWKDEIVMYIPQAGIYYYFR